jgi:putative oxygen-independent coproporphyrinogen III oxidase
MDSAASASPLIPALSPLCGEREGPGPQGREGEGLTRKPLAVYVHWPFCVSKCPYCDFNSHVRERIDAARWVRALSADLEDEAAFAPAHEVVSVFFGGGTPSLMPPEAVAAVIARVRALWPVAPALEVTLEANPNSAEADRFRAFAAAGVNRLSLGVQALDPQDLRFLGRAHDRAEALAAIAQAQDAFARFSFDLIYARPGQTVAQWRRELDEALALAGEHLSLYQLTIEPGTAFASRAARGALAVPDEEVAAQLYETTQERLAAAGLPAYEISNHAQPGAECRHNLAYWNYEDYIGVGPGAHGRLGRDGIKHAIERYRSPEKWLHAVEASGSGVRSRTALDRDTELAERLMMGLRLTGGIARRPIEEAAGCALEALFGTRLAPLIDGGFLQIDAERIAATAAGRQRLNAVLAALLS